MSGDDLEPMDTMINIIAIANELLRRAGFPVSEMLELYLTPWKRLTISLKCYSGYKSEFKWKSGCQFSESKFRAALRRVLDCREHDARYRYGP